MHRSRGRHVPGLAVGVPPAPGDIGDVEHLILSVGLSIEADPLVGLVLTFTPWGLAILAVAIGRDALTLIGSRADPRRRRTCEAVRSHAPRGATVNDRWNARGTSILI